MTQDLNKLRRKRNTRLTAGLTVLGAGVAGTAYCLIPDFLDDSASFNDVILPGVSLMAKQVGSIILIYLGIASSILTEDINDERKAVENDFKTKLYQITNTPTDEINQERQKIANIAALVNEYPGSDKTLNKIIKKPKKPMGVYNNTISLIHSYQNMHGKGTK
ncbi:MAG: hypothetical protein LBF37_01650 [Rickettsiales bacterium]|jgi:hypothetical protein|nr:hypothetical protein [Rickettsiales bacterium]